MKKIYLKISFILGIVSMMACFAFANQEKVIQIFRKGEVIQEYAVSDIDYIEVNDLISSPEDLNATVSDNQITISWNPVEGATYNLYRSPDNTNFTLLASDLSETTYTDAEPLNGANYYRVKAIVNGTESGYTSSVAATLTNPELDNGIYLGITGFNQAIYDYPILQLSKSSVNGFRSFIDNLAMKNGTLLYYSVDQALNAMQTAELPADISTAAIVTFTDGLDQGSMMMDVPYDDDMAYLDALNNRIMTEKVAGQPISAFSIGIRGKDVGDIEMFRANLAKLASSSENATEVTSMAEVNAKFQEIAAQLSQSNYIQTINLKMPGVSNGTLVRFTFDNVNSAENSKLYIEGTFNLKERSLENVKYVGLTSTSGTTIKGTVDNIFVNFKFEGIHTENNVLVKSEFTDEWTYISSNSSWQINSEFDKTENSDIVTERSSAVIMLVLDCSSSLADDFVKAQTNAKDFINTLYGTVDESENSGDDKETIYSTTPKDLSLAVWKDGKRYFLTPEQYQNANLSNAIVEGLTVIFNGEKFILGLSDIHTNSTITKISTVMALYKDILPSADQGIILSTRLSDINNALKSFGGKVLSDPTYTSSTTYSSDYDRYYDCIRGSGGSLSYTSSVPKIRPCHSITDNQPLIWEEPDNFKLSVIIDGKREFISQSDYTDRYSEFDEIEGVLVIGNGEKFIVRLQDEQSDPISNVDTAMQFYKDIMPSAKQGRIISAFYWYIDNAIKYFGGETLSVPTYTSSTTYDSSYGYYYYCICGSGGYVGYMYNNKYTPYVRGVITLETTSETK